MNQPEPTPPLPWVPLVLLAALLCLVPYAMGFPPAERAFPPVPDPLYAQRAALVAFGLLACVAAAVHFVLTLRRCRPALVFAAPSAALFVACFVVGWRYFPYWVVGAYQVDIGAFPARDQDPKSLIPMTWIGELWRLPILLFQLAVVMVAPCLLVAAGIFLWRRRFVPFALTVAGASVAAFFFLHPTSEDYMRWFLD